MNHLAKLVLLLLAATFFVGCSETKPVEEIRSIEWYSQPENREFAHERAKQCREKRQSGKEMGKIEAQDYKNAYIGGS